MVSDGKLSHKLRLEPEDLYGGVSGESKNIGIYCADERPVIKSMAISFIGPSSSKSERFNQEARREALARIVLEGPSIIPFLSGPKYYNFIDAGWRKIQAGIRMAPEIPDAVSLFKSEFNPDNQNDTGFGTGRPLFGDFNFKVIGPLKRVSLEDGSSETYIGSDTRLSEVTEILLHFYYTASESTFDEKLDWIRSCK